MSNLKGITVAAPIVPYTTEDKFPTHYAKYGKGGYRTVQDKTELDEIPEDRLEEGMLAYVIEDPDNIHTYQYLKVGEDPVTHKDTFSWVKSKIGAGVEKVSTILERNNLPSEVGDIVFVEEVGSLFIKLGENEWRQISYGIPIFTKQQEDTLRELGALPDDFISIPDPSELTLQTETTEYESKGNGYYLDIIFSTLRSLQAEVAKLRNSFTYGINSYTGKETAMSSVVGSYDIPDEEPLWAVEEADLSYVGTNLDVKNNNSLSPSENVIVGESGDFLKINNQGATWTDPETGFISVDDTKIYLFMTTNNLNGITVDLTGLNSEVELTKTIDFSDLNLVNYGEDGRYNIMLCLSRSIIKGEETFGKNFLWISVGNYYTGGAENTGYWNFGTNKLQQGISLLDDRYTISSVSFSNLNLYKFDGYSKYQDLSSTVDPITPTEDGYKYRAAHITIRSVRNEEEMRSIKNQLLSDELIYNEQTGVLWIKTSSGSLKPISGSGSQQDDDGMTEEQIQKWLKDNGIIIPEETGESLQLNNISDITFIHQETGDEFTFSVDSEGNLVSSKAPEKTLAYMISKTGLTLNGECNNKRGFVGLLYGKKYNLTQTKDAGLRSDRIKIGAIYSPSKNQQTFGCSHAYIELENTGDEDFPLKGCWLHYATETPDRGIVIYRLELRGVIPAGGTYLIRGKKYSDFEQANTFIKVDTFDQEWYIKNSDNKMELIDLTWNNSNTYLLTYGMQGVTINDQMVRKNPNTDEEKVPNLYHSNYIDSVSIRSHIMLDNQSNWCIGQKFIPPTKNDNPIDVIFKNTFELDPARQAYQSLSGYDSTRIRNEKAIDYQYLFLNKEIIEFPKTESVYPVNKYTPKASWQNKNVCTDKSKLDKSKPNMVTVSYGINMYTTRCFNWISCGHFDEFIWIRREGQTEWEARFESYKSTQENDNPGTSGMTKKTFGTFYNHTVSNENYPIQDVIYNRISGTFPADGTKYTAHKCIVNVVSQAISAGNDPQVYEYIVGRADKNLNPDQEHTSTIQTFTLYPTDYTPRIFQITDQQGFHWIEYQAWAAAAEEVNKTINNTISDTNNKIMPVLINTGDMTQNGTRVNEWYDYYMGGYCLFNHLEQANLVGNNDLCNTDPEILGTGDDNGKSNGYYFHVFYCYEIDENILPIISNVNATKYVPSLYYIQDNNYRFVMLNTEITTINCRDWFKQTKILGEENEGHTVNVYTGWTVRKSDSDNVTMVYDNSFTSIYTMVYDILSKDQSDPNTARNIIVACHEMPFTVITNKNLRLPNVDRSLDKTNSGNLVGCHCNRLSSLDIKGIYWLSRLLENFNVKLCIGGHKHTYACTNPLREFYCYDSDKNSLINGKMTMPRTLSDDTATWSIDLGEDTSSGGKTYYTTEGSGSDITIDTSKFPIMVNSSGGVTKVDSDNIYYPFYGVNSFSNNEKGVVYFMCQATGYKLKSNKELPSNNQKFSYVIPQTTMGDDGDTPNNNQLFPMYSEIVLIDDTYDIYLYRLKNIMVKDKFSQSDCPTDSVQYNCLQGQADDIYGSWSGNNVRQKLISVS